MNGAERTTLYPIVEEAARRFDLTIKPDPRPDAGTYYRSDHFSFARVGIPSFSIDGGEDLLGKPPGTGKKLFDDFEAHRYHQPSDEYHDDWDFSGMEQYARFGFTDRNQRRQRAPASNLEHRRRVSRGSRFKRRQLSVPSWNRRRRNSVSRSTLKKRLAIAQKGLYTS